MPRSMTGQGEARHESSFGLLRVELRTVNNRGLKVAPRLGESLSRFEPRVESLLRSLIHRGTVQVNLRWQRDTAARRYRINAAVLQSYHRQLRLLQQTLEDAAAVDLTALTALPGVIEEAEQDVTADDAELWQAIEEAVRRAVDDLDQMRCREGAAMADALRKDTAEIARRLEAIGRLAPRVVDHYRDRLRGRIESYLAANGLEVGPVDLLRELQLYADRSDISEEVTRLESHLKVFDQHLRDDVAAGRRLEFVVQEMFRETNTIGSKASDAEISAHVVEIKCALERMRELVQNIE